MRTEPDQEIWPDRRWNEEKNGRNAVGGDLSFNRNQILNVEFKRPVSLPLVRKNDTSPSTLTSVEPTVEPYVPPPSVLSRLLRRRQWALAAGRMRQEAHLASHDGYPLHVACELRPRAPLYVLRDLLRAHPRAARELRPECGSLPMHVLVSNISLMEEKHNKLAIVPVYKDQQNRNFFLEEEDISTFESNRLSHVGIQRNAGGDNFDEVLAMLKLLHDEYPDAVVTPNKSDNRLPLHVASASTKTVNGMVASGPRRVLDWLLHHTPTELASFMRDAHGFTAAELAWRGVQFYCTSCQSVGSHEVCDCLQSASIPTDRLHPLFRNDVLPQDDPSDDDDESTIPDDDEFAYHERSSSEITFDDTYGTDVTCISLNEGHHSRAIDSDGFFTAYEGTETEDDVENEGGDEFDVPYKALTETFSADDDEICKINMNCRSEKTGDIYVLDDDDDDGEMHDNGESSGQSTSSQQSFYRKKDSPGAEDLEVTTGLAVSTSASVGETLSMETATGLEKDTPLPQDSNCGISEASELNDTACCDEGIAKYKTSTTIIRNGPSMESSITLPTKETEDVTPKDDSNICDASKEDSTNATSLPISSISFDTQPSSKSSQHADDEGGGGVGGGGGPSSGEQHNYGRLLARKITSNFFPLPKPLKRVNAILRMQLRVFDLQRPYRPEKTISGCTVRGKPPNPYYELVVAQKHGTRVYKSYPLWRKTAATWDEAIVDLGVPSMNQSKLQLQVHIRLLHLSRNGKAQLIGTCRASSRNSGIRHGIDRSYPIVHHFQVMGHLSVVSMGIE